MQSVQESKQELEAAVRYAENAISSAKATIESMVFRQEMAQKNYSEKTGREQALERDLTVKTSQAEAWRKEYEKAKKEADELRSKVQGQYDDIVQLERDLAKWDEGKGDAERRTIEQLEYDLTAKTAQANAWKKKYYDFKETLVRAGDPRVVDKPTMPVIPKAVAIAIFREGLAHGAEAVATEIDNACDICIEESDYVSNFEVSFTKDIDLSDHLDTDWLRGRADEIGETFVLDCLANLCADNEFECRIHGVDDVEAKDSPSS